MKVGVIGCGVVGSAVLKSFQKRGVETVGYDPYVEGLQDASVLEGCEVLFLCLPTESYADGSQNLGPIESTFHMLEERKFPGVVCLKSTVAPGTTEAMADKYHLSRVCHNPEFLTAAKPLEDFEKQPAITIGGPEEAALIVKDAYVQAGFSEENVTYVLYPRAVQSEITKYFHNIMLALKAMAANGFYKLCQYQGVNYMDTIEGALAIGQVGRNHIKVPGPDGSLGVGGMCFPKDMQALARSMRDQGVPFGMLEAAILDNKTLRSECYVGDKIKG